MSVTCLRPLIAAAAIALVLLAHPRSEDGSRLPASRSHPGARAGHGLIRTSSANGTGGAGTRVGHLPPTTREPDMGQGIIAMLVGALAGLHAATWGMYKDSLYEGFCWRKYRRSVVVGALAALVIQAVLPGDLLSAAGLVVLFGLTYVVERGAVEWHKSFVRVEDQSKYFIPMQFAVGGRVVRGRAVRLSAGVAYAGVLVLIVSGLIALERAALPWPPVALALLLGSIGGWVAALGGAWKDAPKEGFQLFKFFRSPAVAAGFGLLLGVLTDSYLGIAFGGLGYSIATIETHKKFRNTLEAPGKFAGTPVRFPEMIERRRPFAAVYASVWAVVLVTMAVALATATGGLVAAAQVAAR